jgi:hypothetical protein
MMSGTTGSARRGGLRLPLSITLLAALSVTATMAFTTSDSGQASLLRRQAELDAYARAQSGLERFIAERAAHGLLGTPAGEESAEIVLADGSAAVSLHRVRTASPDRPALYLLRSHSAAVVDGRAAGEQRVSQLAVWQTGRFAPRAVWTVTDSRPVRMAGHIDGRDLCGSGQRLPAVDHADRAAGIDWRGIDGGTALVAGAAIPAAEAMRYSQPERAPIIRGDGDHELRRSGSGTLIVKGDLQIMNEREWRGLILVGGRVSLHSGARVEGAVVSGLDAQLGAAPAGHDVIGAGASVRFDSCAIAAAADAFGTLAPIPSTWLDGAAIQ